MFNNPIKPELTFTKLRPPVCVFVVKVIPTMERFTSGNNTGIERDTNISRVAPTANIILEIGGIGVAVGKESSKFL